MRAAFAVAVVAVSVLATARSGAAQARVLVAPSAGAGMVFDDNLFSAPQGLATGDTIVRVTPGLSASRESQHGYLFAGYTFDAERYQDHETLTTPLARQTATAFGRVETSPVTVVSFSGGYDSSVTPGELNETTGLFTDRVRGWRAHAGPQIKHNTSPATSVTWSYDLSTESIAQFQVATHAADVTLAHAVGARDEWRLAPFVREFMFNTGQLGSAGATVGWTHKITPLTSVSLQAGPRVTQDDPTIRPEIDALVRRRTSASEFSMSYTRTATVVAGLTGLLETQHATASYSYHHPAVVDVAFQGGVYFNQQNAISARVYQVGGSVTRRFSRALSLAASYTLDLQRGLLTTTQFIGDVTAAERGSISLVTPLLPPATPVQVVRTTNDVPLRRNVIMLQLIVSPTLRPTREPPTTEPAPEPLPTGSLR